MNKIKYIIIIVISGLFLNSSGQDNLNDYLQIASENNPELKAKFYQYRASLEKIAQAGSLPDPQISFAYFIEPVETRLGPQKAKIGASQMFPWFGTLNAKEEVEAQKAKAEYQEFLDLKNKIHFKVKKSYFELYFTKRAISIAKENLKILRLFKSMAITKIEAGKTSAADGLRIDMEINDIEYSIAKLQDNFLVKSIEFNKTLNRDRSAEVKISDSIQITDINYSKRMLRDSILKNNHQLSKIGYQISSLKQSEIFSKKLSMPDISIGFEYISIDKVDNLSGKDAIVFPKIGLSIPLYNKKYKALTKEAVLKQNSAEQQKLSISNNLEIVFEDTYNNYTDAERRLQYYKKQKGLAEKTLKLLKYDYSSNTADFEELLRIERKLLKYNLEYERAIADKLMSLAYINYLTSK